MPVTMTNDLPQRDPGTGRVRARSEARPTPEAGTPAFLADAEVKDAEVADESPEVSDEPAEDEASPDDADEPAGDDQLVHRGGGWYELPNGERVHGREAAEAALEADG